MTRDIPLVMVEAWYKCFAGSIPEVFGFPWPVPLFIFRGGVVESWRPIEHFHRDLPLRTSRWINQSKAHRKKFLRAVQLYDACAQKAHNWDLKRIPSPRTVESIITLADLFTKGCAGLIPLFWFLEWSEKFPGFYDGEILSVARKARASDSFMDDVTDLIYGYLAMLAKKNHWPLGLTKLLTRNELLNLVKKPSNFPVHVLAKRRQGYLYTHSKILSLAELPKTLKRRKYVLSELPTRRQFHTLRGNPASGGKVRGKVVVVKTRDRLHLVRKGSILVAPMTTPWYISGMQRASAFVTDEGGMNSHAAIIAREMNKPCIVGTKIATKVLKDGDLVEVNADKGIVRKISA